MEAAEWQKPSNPECNNFAKLNIEDATEGMGAIPMDLSDSDDSHNIDTDYIKPCFSSQHKLHAPGDLGYLKQQVDDMLRSNEIKDMTPVQHWEWAKSLLPGSEVQEIPSETKEALHKCAIMTDEEVHDHRHKAKKFWLQRKLDLTSRGKRSLTPCRGTSSQS